MDRNDEQQQAAPWPTGVGMVYFGMSPWHGMWKSRHQLMSRFSEEMPVLYVEPWVGLRSFRTGKTRLSRVVTDIGRTIEHCEPNVTVYHCPAYLPVSGSDALAGPTTNLWIRAVLRVMRTIGISKPIIWVSRPERRVVVGKLGEILSIYHVVDEYGGYTGVSDEGRRKLAAAEAELLDSVDLIVVASPELRLAKEGPARDIEVLENGVEPSDYAKALDSRTEPDDLAAIPRPRIGYSGLIGKRLDLELTKRLAVQRPDYSIVMVGKIDTRECEQILAELESLPNVYFLGEKPADQVASYVVGFDIGLLPYQINLETRHISPIKMYEYWAAGKPVVSTAIPAAQRHKGAVHVAESHDEFCSMIDDLVQEKGRDDPAYLLELARRNSWQSRVDRIAAELRSRIGAS